jgi:hypothetical protein
MVAGDMLPANKSARDIEESLAKIVAHIAESLNPEKLQADGSRRNDISDFAEKSRYAQILESVAKLEKSIPRARTLTFRFTWRELLVLLVYGAGGLLLTWLATQTSRDWTASNLVSVLAYWTVIVGILLGSQAIPKILRSSI